MKLELKHVLPYFIYGLKGLFFGVEDIVIEIELEIRVISGLNYGAVQLKDFKPILRPLSDFINEINEDDYQDSEFGEYVGGDWCDIYDDAIFHILESKKNMNIEALPFHLIEYLLSKNYDIFNLISNNLAVNINDL